MKYLASSLAAVLVCTSALFAAPPADQKNQVDVAFDQPEKFTDVRDSYTGTDKGRDGLLGLLKEHLQQRAPRYLPEGQKLSVTFTDVDLAGDYEPWRGVNFHDVRIVKDIYPPRLNFTYKVTDASGAVVKEGSEKLVELAFQMSASPMSSQDSLRYEKAMLDNWLRDTFPKPKKSGAKKKG